MSDGKQYAALSWPMSTVEMASRVDTVLQADDRKICSRFWPGSMHIGVADIPWVLSLDGLVRILSNIPVDPGPEAGRPGHDILFWC